MPSDKIYTVMKFKIYQVAMKSAKWQNLYFSLQICPVIKFILQPRNMPSDKIYKAVMKFINW